jgi:hypothetical protein
MLLRARFVSGHDFSHAANTANILGLQPLRDGFLSNSVFMQPVPETVSLRCADHEAKRLPEEKLVHKRGLDLVLSFLLLACSFLVLGIFVLGEALRRAPALLRLDGRRAGESSEAFAVHSAGEFDFYRAIEAYEKLIDAEGAARQT